MFDDLTDIYEAMIDWPKRLANEEPFYRRLFESVVAHRVVDVACGTGRHAAMFHSWGLEVEAADISPNMIERAKAAVGQPPSLRWVVRGFDQPISPKTPFDAAICVGNSLALAPDAATAERALREMLAAVHPGGVVVVHVLNLRHLPDGLCHWQKCLRTRLPQGDVLILKGVRRCGSHGYMDLVVAPLDEPSQMRSESVRLLALDPVELESMALVGGAARARFFGGYHEEPFVHAQSADLVMIAEK